MNNFDRKKHWEEIYKSKKQEDVSWYQPKPEASLEFLEQFKIAKNAKIIDIGGGDSFLVDHLIELGYKNITVLDISEVAIDKAKQRLGEKANNVKWILSDASHFTPSEKYDFWHDRAAFHFLTDEQEINDYLQIAHKNINPAGVFVLGTFSDKGPKKCSGIEIKQYSEETMNNMLTKYFNKVKCISVNHTTPSDTIQNFIFCSFKNKQ